MQDQQEIHKQSDQPRRWFRPQFGLRTMFYIVTWVAVAASLNLGAPRIVSGSSKNGFYFVAYRGYPFEYLSFQSRDYDPEPRLDHRGWPVAEPLPFVSNWLALAANAVAFVAVAVACWLALKWIAELASAVHQSLYGSRDAKLRVRLLPATFLLVLGLATTFWVIWYFAWTNRYYWNFAMRHPNWSMLSEFEGWRTLGPGLLAGSIAIGAGRLWLRPFSSRTLVLSLLAIGLLAFFAWTAFFEGKLDT